MVWNSVILTLQCMNILRSETGEGENSFFRNKCDEILSFVPLAGLLGGLAWMPPGELGGLVPCWAWLASLLPDCCLLGMAASSWLSTCLAWFGLPAG